MYCLRKVLNPGLVLSCIALITNRQRIKLILLLELKVRTLVYLMY